MTRQNVFSDYVVINGVIKSPGKFEGQPLYAPYFWDLMLEGGGFTYENEEEGVVETEFVVEQGDLDEFPELKDYDRVYIWDDDQGFVHCEGSNDDDK